MTISSRLCTRGAGRITVVLAFMFVPPAFPWGCEGHRVVALIASEQLTPHAKAEAAQLLESPVYDSSLHRYCPASSLPPLADLASWADDVRGQRRETAGWHFIDVPLQARKKEISQFCPASGCVTSAIRQQNQILRSDSATKKQKAEALLFIVHFVGDLHQPLHSADNDDRGGNCVAVAFFDHQPEASGTTQSYRPNLHGVWDTDLLERISRGEDAASLAAALRAQFAREMKGWLKRPVDLEGWVWDSHEAAVKFVYGKLPAKIPLEIPRPVESCADHDMGKRMFDLHERIDQKYLEAVTPVIRRQLAIAGTHLAALLNQIWP